MFSIRALALSLALFTTAASAGKRGLAWPFCTLSSSPSSVSTPHEPDFSSTSTDNAPLDPGVLNNGQGQVVAIYDWETFAPPSTNGNGGLGFIGTQRCMDCDSSPVAQLRARQAQQGWATVFSLNEPDQAGISPSAAADWYVQWINPLAIKKALPAITSSTSPGQGLDWLNSMINACAGRCFADYINLHWYGNSFPEFQNYITGAHNRFPQFNVVISEFALQNPSGGQSAQVAFFRQAFAWLDAQPWVILYFPFVATSPALLQANDPGAASFVGTGSTLYNNNGLPSASLIDLIVNMGEGEIVWLTIPRLLGFAWNWGLMGTLTVQVYVYHISFQGDRVTFKALVYALYLLEWAQTLLATYDAVHWFGYGWGNKKMLKQIYTEFLDVPVFTSTIGAAVQIFFGWRIFTLSHSKVLFGFIILMALIQLTGAAVAGYYVGCSTAHLKIDIHTSVKFTSFALIQWKVMISWDSPGQLVSDLELQRQ
ncbi:hypothetical protein K435DRAFT_868898 [Dendrothele bispora CBS 962.96]|uniref:Asl1-like glycosyl hydrolase catalytic domain-containing protein n=1 Tax=Dendrothele bispora (strain CBS 962.96) TaxID=1314807 RepID=A0A4S8LAP7_DENBC|nr:hypothetical protein K435DRAFT_868898 [Dendrothele bispora CBS 962.96]